MRHLESLAASLLAPSLLGIVEGDALTQVLALIGGAGGLYGIVRVWMAATEKRDQRADERLSAILAAAQKERETDRGEERAERERSQDRFERLVGTLRESSEKLAGEVRGLREDVVAGRACRYPVIPSADDPQWLEARPRAKPDGTRGG